MSAPEVESADRSSRRRLTTLLLVALLAAALVAIVLSQVLGGREAASGPAARPRSATVAPGGADAGPSATAGEVVGGSGDSQPDSVTVAEPALGVIQGVDVQAVTAAWQTRWKVTLKDDPKLGLHSAIVDYPAANGRLHLIVATAAGGVQAVSVRCIVEHGTKKVDRKLLQAMVTDCLAPALKEAERADVTDWLAAQDYKLPASSPATVRSKKTSMQRFDVKLEILKGNLRAGIVGRP